MGAGGIAVVVGLLVLAAQLGLVAAAGTEAPWGDAWDVEGARLYPKWVDGSLGWRDVFAPVNEHRIAWTLGLDLGLFAANGQWDPRVQLVANAVLRAAVAGGLAWWAARNRPGGGWGGGVAAAGAIGAAFLPVLAWHEVLWAFESQVVWALGFSLLALGLLGARERTWGRTAAGLAAGGAALVAMGAGALVPVALLGLAAWAWRVEAPGPVGLRAESAG